MGWGEGKSLRRDVTFFASLPGPLLRRCAVCVTHSVWRIEDFAGFRTRDETQASLCKLLCRHKNCPPYCSRQVSGSSGVSSPGRSSGSLVGAPRWPCRLPGRASPDLPSLAARPGAIFFRLPLAGLSPAAMMYAPCPFFQEVAG